MVWYGSRNGYQKDVYLEEIGLCEHDINFRFNGHHNLGGGGRKGGKAI